MVSSVLGKSRGWQQCCVHMLPEPLVVENNAALTSYDYFHSHFPRHDYIPLQPRLLPPTTTLTHTYNLTYHNPHSTTTAVDHTNNDSRGLEVPVEVHGDTQARLLTPDVVMRGTSIRTCEQDVRPGGR